MKHKKQILQFLEDNSCMINSLMGSDERKSFGGDVVKIIADDIKRQMDKDNRSDKCNNFRILAEV